MQFRLRLLSVLLVIQTINSTAINESLIDQYSQNVATESLNSQRMDTEKNQSNRPVNYSNDQVQNMYANIDASKPTKQLTKPASNLTGGKTFNKIDFRKRKVKSVVIDQTVDWMCPIMTENSQYLECGCDLPHTLRCSGDIHGLEEIADGLRHSNYSVSLLDCTLKNVTFLSDARIFENVSLHGLVISSGEIKRVHRLAFLGMKTPLQALGLPNNALTDVPYQSLSSLTSLDRLDLSNNRIKYLGAADFLMLQNLSFLELSDNHISGISMRAFLTLKRLEILKLNGNRLEANGNALQAIGQCVNLKELDLSSNLLRGSLTNDLLPPLKSLESLNLDTNLLTSIHSTALESFSYLKTLSMSHNQIDVLQDHAFSGLTSLQILDLSYNGIVAVSGASLKHLTRLLVLNLTHNFLRALSSDLIAPLPSLRELQLDGNDISIVANAFESVTNLERLSLQDNPLSCDCSLKPFAEWLSMSKISQKDQLSAVCATPPHLEGATLQQIPLGSLNCNGNVNKVNNANVLQQLEIRSKQTNLTYDTKFSDEIILKKIHLSMDYGLILTWSIGLRNHEFSCDTILVYKESNSNETLVGSPTVHCEHYRIENENIVSVILYDTGRFVIGENYRFCLVMIQRDDDDQELVVGCSNITKLKQIENNLLADDQPKKHINIAKIENIQIKTPDKSREQQIVSDISSFDKISDSAQDEFPYDNDLPEYSSEKTITKTTTIIDNEVENEHETTTITLNAMRKSSEKLYAPRLIDTIDESFFPVIGIAVLITSLFGLIWIGTKLSNNRRSNPATVCYAASDQHSVDIENRNQYLKLQATTTL